MVTMGEAKMANPPARGAQAHSTGPPQGGRRNNYNVESKSHIIFDSARLKRIFEKVYSIGGLTCSATELYGFENSIPYYL